MIVESLAKHRNLGVFARVVGVRPCVCVLFYLFYLFYLRRLLRKYVRLDVELVAADAYKSLVPHGW